MTLPRASSAPFPTPDADAYWHVHLELKPEELVALHKLGLTKGAIAWREGMPTWQPLKDAGEVPPAAGGLDAGAKAFGEPSPPGASDWSDDITIASERDLSRPARPALDSDPRSMGLSAPKRRATLPPTSPLFASGGRPHLAPVTATPVRAVPAAGVLPPPPLLPGVSQPAGNRVEFGAGGAPKVRSGAAPASSMTAGIAAEPRLPSFSDPDARPVVPQLVPSVAPMAFEPAFTASSGRRRALWFGAAGLAALSVIVGTVASGALSSGRSSAPGAEPSHAASRVGADAASTSDPSTTQGLAPVPLDQLPLADKVSKSGTTAAAATPSESTPSARSGAGASASDQKPVPAAGEDRQRTTLAASTRDSSGHSTPDTGASGGADVKAIAKAVSVAARAASSCGASPQSGKVALTFSPSGAVRSVQMEEPFAERDVGSCVLRAMGRAKVAAFDGEPVVVKKSVSW